MADPTTDAGAAVALLTLDVPEVPSEIPDHPLPDALALVGAPEDEPDLAPAHERVLGEWARKKHGSDFLAVEGYPMVKRPFYTHPRLEACLRPGARPVGDRSAGGLAGGR